MNANEHEPKCSCKLVRQVITWWLVVPMCEDSCRFVDKDGMNGSFYAQRLWR